MWVDSGACNGDDCSYTVHVQSTSGNTGGVNRNVGSYVLNYKRPQVFLQLSSLSNFTSSSAYPVTIAQGGQSLNVTLGGQSGYVSQAINYLGGNNWHANATYSNGLSSPNLSFAIGSIPSGIHIGDNLVSFTRSDGYDISNFAMTQVDNQKKLSTKHKD